MPNVGEFYEEQDTRQLTRRVVVAGQELPDVLDIEWHFGPSRVPTATVRITNPPPSRAVFFADVYIDTGFNGVTERVFTGKVWNVRRDAVGTVLKCVGKSWPLDTDFRKVVVTLSSTTAATAIAALLDELGIDDYKIDVPAWTIGTVVAQTLEFQTYGEAIMHIAEVGGGRWYEAPTGTVIVEVWDAIPSNTATRSYFSMQLSGVTESYPTGVSTGRPRLRSARKIEEVEDVKNRVFVRGAAVTTTDSEGVENTADIEAEASAPSQWVLHADGSQSYNDMLFSNELIDVAAKAADEAVRLVTLKNRLGERGTLVIDGDPRLKLAETVRVEDKDYSGMTGRWFVEAYACTLTPASFVSEVELRGGANVGSTVNLSPTPLFYHRIEREVIGDRVWAVITFDAKNSHDRDGSIVTFAWADNQAPQIATGSAEVFTVRVDPSTVATPWDVTLTVTDNDGASTSLLRTVDIDQGSEDVFVPALYVAFDNQFSCTPDGGVTWNDVAHAPGGVVSVACWPNAEPGIACFGTEAGEIYRTTDFCASALTMELAVAGGDNTFVHIAWDWRNPLAVWAVTQDGRLYLSQDAGDNWAIYENLRDKLGIGGLRVSRIGLPGGGGIWIYGGSGTGIPVIAFDPAVGDHNWGLVGIGGDLLEDVQASLTPDLYIADASDRGSGLAIILNSATFTPSVYFNDDPHGDGSNWTRATGLPAKSVGRWIEYDLQDDRFAFQYDDNVVYLGDVNFGVDPAVMAASAAGGTLDAGDESSYGLAFTVAFGNPIAGTYLVAGEGAVDGTVYKTWDRFTTVSKLRPATGFPAPPGGANAKMIAIGQRVLLDERVIALARDGGNPQETALLGVTDTWTSPDVVAGDLGSAPRIYPLTDQLWFAVNGSGNIQLVSGTGRRTEDGGGTWGDTPDPEGGTDGIFAFAIDTGGRVWCAVRDGVAGHYDIHWSSDDGDTWNPSRVIDDGLIDAVWKIIPHPSNQDILAVISYHTTPSAGAIHYTLDRGTTWAVFTDSALRRWDASTDFYYDAVMLANNRLIAIGPLSSSGSPATWRAIYSDDWGDNWTVAFSVGGDNVRFSNIFTDPGGTRVGFVYVEDYTASPGSWHLALSTNGGSSFTVTALGAELETLWTTDIDTFSSAPSDQRDALYMILRKGVTANAFKLTPVNEAGIWTDITSDLDQTLDYDLKGMAVIPRVGA